MDLDVVSNCSSTSLQSDDVRSNASTLSGLSAYQDEFTELRHLVHPTKYPSYTLGKRCSTPKLDSGFGSQFEESVNVSGVLPHFEHSQHMQDNKYKFDLYNLEKNLELKYYDKIEKLLKANHRLQSELDSANDQIARLLKNYSKQYTPSILDKNFIELEQKYHGLTLKYSELQSDYFNSRNQKEEYEIENKQLKIELNELKTDVETKSECIREFKNKVSRQYVEIETSSKDNSKISQSLNEVTLELVHVRKTQEWYKERLQLCQNEKQKLSNEILECKIELSSKHEGMEILKVELSKWKANCDMIKLEALKDKEKLCKQLESMTLLRDSKNDQSKFSSEVTDDLCVINYYEMTIQDLTHEIGQIKEYLQEQDSLIQKVTKENSVLMSRCITLQEHIRQNESAIEELEDTKKWLKTNLDEMRNKLKEKSDDVTVTENKIFTLQAELTVKKEEQQLIEQAVKTIREQFSAFKSNHKELKDELNAKNKQILQIENEKQKLFMHNNWTVCELEKLKAKDIIINQLKEELNKNNELIKEHLATIKVMENKINKNQEQTSVLLDEKQTTIEKNHLEIQRYENVLTQYKIMVTNYEKQIADLQKFLHESQQKVADLKDNIKILKQEINEKDANLNEINNKCINLESEIKNCSKIVESNTVRGQSENKSNSNSVILFSEHNNTRKNNVDVLVNCNKSMCSGTSKKNLLIVSSSHKNQLALKIVRLEDRIKKINETSNECSDTLNVIFNIVKDNGVNEKINRLNVLLQVKELEIKEKRKKYEANNRTLLRKVKEHMKGRNAAEKQNRYLQEMYNSLSDENNSLKLEVGSKECEIENIKNTLDKFTNMNEKLKSSIFKFEEQASRSKSCDMCESFKDKVELLEKCVKELENEKLAFQNVLMNKEDVINNLQNEIQHLLQKNTSQNTENKKFADEIRNLSNEKNSLTSTITTMEKENIKRKKYEDELNILLKQEQDKNSEISLDNNHLKHSLNEMSSRIGYLENEIGILSSRLQAKSEELNHLEDKKSKMESNWLEKENDSQCIINTLKRYVRDMQSEITSINNEKYFLQRLCNDLKLALKSHVSHNKVLKQQLEVVSKEKDFSSLPNVLPNLTCDIKYNDDFINQLLQQNRTPIQGKSILEMKNGLDTLKREVSTLQEQIARRNIQYYE